MAEILALVPDLMFGTRIQESVRRLGHSIEIVATARQVEEALIQTKLCIVSLDAPDWEQGVRSAKQARVRVLAFGSHRGVQLMQAAQAAGCDLVVARSRMAKELPALIGKFME